MPFSAPKIPGLGFASTEELIERIDNGDEYEVEEGYASLATLLNRTFGRSQRCQ
ncbi:MAG: hypothetical protein IPL23_10940 [Saprospiraceae bacterium]|nr:hypothetical protein [Saprospiraceae bacterium]